MRCLVWQRALSRDQAAKLLVPSPSPRTWMLFVVSLLSLVDFVSMFKIVFDLCI